MRILLAEDDINLNQLLTRQLEDADFTVDSCYDGDDALYLGSQNIHDIILLDRMLPHMDGLSVLQELRKKQITIPVLMITALGTLQDKVTGLNLGADDYLVKPFAFEELLARIYCVTRRSPVLMPANDICLADITYCPDTAVLTGPAGTCSLSNREGSLLEAFVRQHDQTLPRTNLLLKVWGPDSDVEDGNLDNYIHFLRRRLHSVGSHLTVQTVRGIGYRLNTTT